MDYSHIEILMVYSGEFFKEKEIKEVGRLFSKFDNGKNKIDAKKLEEIVNNPRIIKRFVDRGILTMEGKNYKIQENKIQELIEEVIGSESEYLF